MTNSGIKQDHFAVIILSFAKVCGHISEDVGNALLGFIPNGLNSIYDDRLKKLPFIGKFFAHRWVEQLMKLCTGITIGRGFADDIAYYIFRPLGFMVGIFLGAIFQTKLDYHGQVGKWLHPLSGQTVGGALFALLAFAIALLWVDDKERFINLGVILGVVGFGALVGLMAKGLLLLAIDSVNATNATTIRKNVQRAKEWNTKLKNAAKRKAKNLILIQAHDIIQQMNGPQSQQHLEVFFENKFSSIASSIYQKIDRHFNYLTDRACHGDLKALKRMQDLLPKAAQMQTKSSFDVMIERMFNQRALFKLKDEVDTIYDEWQYRDLLMNIGV